MFFLLRMVFWLGLVCVLLPGSNSGAPEAQVDAGQALTVASAAVSDARGFCDRQPQACVVGGQVASAIGHKAEAGARTLYQFISARLVDTPNEKSASGHGTLTSSDLQPVWHAPVPLPPRREPRSRPAV